MRLKIEVYDCMKGIEFAPGLRIQMGSGTQEFNAVKSNPNLERCGKNILQIDTLEGPDYVLQYQSAEKGWLFKEPRDFANLPFREEIKFLDNQVSYAAFYNKS